MSLPKIDRSVRELLEKGNLFLRRHTVDDVDECVLVCWDDGHPGGSTVGQVRRFARTWTAVAQVRPRSPFSMEEVAWGLPGVDQALLAVLRHARDRDGNRYA